MNTGIYKQQMSYNINNTAYLTLQMSNTTRHRAGFFARILLRIFREETQSAGLD